MTMNDVELVMSPLGIDQFRRERVLPHTLMLAQRVQEGAKAQLRFGHVHAGMQDVGGRRRSSGAQGNLIDTIVKRVIKVSPNPTVLVGSDSDHAIFVHDGTRPHVIRPRNARALFFFSGNIGMYVVVPATPFKGGYVNKDKVLVSGKGYVMHPGTKPNRFLTDNLHLATIG